MTLAEATATLRPGNLAEAREAVLDSSRGRALFFRGGGTKLDWGAPLLSDHVVIETSGLNRVLAHNAADATAIVQAGIPLADLQAELGGSRQWLAIDPPHPAATVGGVFAANDAGPRRLRYGTMRDLIIGMTMITSDGAVARSGGQVIKNVAGYDLAKLLAGSLGTLGLVAELVVRLHPLPEASRTIVIAADPPAATRIALDLLASPLEPTAVEYSGGHAHVRFTGRSAAVDEQAVQLQRLVGAGTSMPAGEDEHAMWSALREAHAGAEGQTVARVATLPSRFADVAEAVEHVCRDTGVTADLVSSVALGLHTASFSDGDDIAHVAAVQALRREVTRLGGHVVVRRRRPGLTDPELIWGPVPAAGLMRSVKEQLDPGRRCAPGRFVAGI